MRFECKESLTLSKYKKNLETCLRLHQYTQLDSALGNAMNISHDLSAENPSVTSIYLPIRHMVLSSKLEVY